MTLLLFSMAILFSVVSIVSFLDCHRRSVIFLFLFIFLLQRIRIFNEVSEASFLYNMKCNTTMNILINLKNRSLA